MSTAVTQIRTRFEGGWELLMSRSESCWPGEMAVALRWPQGNITPGPDGTFEEATTWATTEIESFQEWYARDGDLLD